MLKIYIEPQTQIITTAEGQKFRVQKIDVTDGANTRYLDNIPSFGKIDDITLFATRRDYGGYVSLKISPKIKEAIVDFLQNQHGQKDLNFDCYSFVCNVTKITENSKFKLVAYWDLNPLPARCRIGDVLFFIDMHAQKFLHAAVYIGQGLCIQVMEPGGGLEACKLENIRAGLMAPSIFLAVPRT